MAVVLVRNYVKHSHMFYGLNVEKAPGPAQQRRRQQTGPGRGRACVGGRAWVPFRCGRSSEAVAARRGQRVSAAAPRGPALFPSRAFALSQTRMCLEGAFGDRVRKRSVRSDELSG